MTVSEYNQCVDAFADNLFRFVVKNIRDKEQAKDIVQDVYEKFWLRRSGVEYSKAKSYLFTAAHHTMIDAIRKESRNVRLDAEIMNEPECNEQYSDLQELLHIAIDKLSAIQKSVVMLRDYEGYSYTEIAEITGLNEAQVKVYIYRARVFLKNYIGSMDVVV